ncbi:PAS domain S-box protein [Halioxenophilus sp. WMMB6]|uniref:sensor histidine kinase n=1 Tax=Halioxenophilus sp. WMMB6 TaxID=3073815 RepID=UPI00295F0D05|nr:PAS domain S-box protein [Halioxenophilus sp. WMMB6]
MNSLPITNQSRDDLMIRLTLEASPNAMVLIDHDGKILLVNSSLESLFGYQRDELMDRSIDLLVPERFRHHHPHQRSAYFKRPIARTMASGMELYGLHKDGSEIPLEIGLNPIIADGKSFVIAAITDITERKRAHDMMRLAVEAAPNGMIMTDADGLIILVNNFAERLFGYSREELVGKEISWLVPQRFRENHKKLRKDYYDNPISRAMGKGRDLYAVHKDGREIPVEIGINPINTPNGTMILASVVDIAERKQQEEELLKAIKEKEVLLSEIHHRVKNNLQIIDSLLGMQLDTLESEREVNAIIESKNRVKSMALIHQALYQSKDLSRVDMATVITNLRENLLMSYGADLIEIELNLAPILLPIDSSIPLSLIINELISNALKHAFEPKATGLVSVTLAGDIGNIQLLVTDTGRGIDGSVDFYNNPSLGLRLIFALVDQLGGEVVAIDRFPTRFEFAFNLQEAG